MGGDDESPQITSKPPSTTECPFDEEPSRCVEIETRNWVDAHFENIQDESIEILPEDIIIEVRRKDRVVNKFTIPTEDWPCVQDALDDIRSRHSKLLDSELSKIIERSIEEISQRIRITCPEPEFDIIKVPTEVRVPSETELVISWLSNTLGLQRRIRPSITVGNIARRKIKPFGRDPRSGVTKTARALQALLKQMPSKEKAILLEALTR